MVFFVKNFFIFFSIIELTPLLDLSDCQHYNWPSFYFWILAICFFLNSYLNSDINYNLSFDLVFKYFILMFKNPSFFFNYSLNTFKKIIVFLYYFKYRTIRKTFTVFYKRHLSSFFINWKPLFKKTSYFGYFRSNRSKWIK